MDISKWLYVLIFVLYRESLSTDNVEPRKDGRRIVGGQETDIEFHPYQVKLLTGCGGSIIGRRWILTAAHCYKENYMSGVSVGSSTNKVSIFALHKIRSVTIHPLYFTNEFDVYYDFMLLELYKPLVYGATVRPIEIGKEEDIVAGKYGIATGWGDIDTNETQTSVLRGVALPIIDLYRCQQIFNMTLLPIVFCAGFEEGRSTCMGDSGGPLVVDGKLLGVFSYLREKNGQLCGVRGNPTVFGSVPKVRSWIHRVTDI